MQVERKAMTDQFIGKVLAEKYQIESLISEGILGNLYHGTHLLMEKPVAVKTLPSALANETIVKSFSNEARTVSRISHPNILGVTDYGSDEDGTVFIVYENSNSETLKQMIQRVGKLSLKRANNIVKEIASALSLAHANGVVHQNLSSQNVLVDNNFENVKVLNFGTSTFDINDLDYPIEKIQYLSPEQCTITGKINNQTDVYALGIILYEMLAGEVPFKANNGTDLMIKQAQEPPPPITAFRNDLPNEVDDILLTALAKNPSIRYQTVNEFADALNQASLLVSDTGEQETIVIPQRFLPDNTVAAKEAPQNNLWKTAFIVLAGVTLLGMSFIYMTSGKQTNPSTQLQTDANGSPVQPAPPPTGTMEQTLANMDSYNPNVYGSNSNTGIPEGEGTYNPYWDKGGRPPGAPPVTGYGDPYPVQQVAPGGQQVYIDPGNGSIFMPQDDGSYVVMAPKPSNTASNVNTPPKKNANTATPPTDPTAKPSPTPATANTTTAPKVTPTPATKPKATPKTEPSKPATTEKRPVSGKEQDTNLF